jgi:hypothetical protein
MVFDWLYVNGHSLLGRRLKERQQILGGGSDATRVRHREADGGFTSAQSRLGLIL